MRTVWRISLIVFGISMGQLSLGSEDTNPFTVSLIPTIVVSGVAVLSVLVSLIAQNTHAIAQALNPEKTIPGFGWQGVIGTIPWGLAAVAIPAVLSPEQAWIIVFDVGLIIFVIALFAHLFEHLAHVAKALDANANTTLNNPA